DDTSDATDDDADTTTTTAAEAPEGTTAGEGGQLTMLQWQAPSQANAYLSTGTKDLLAGSLVLEPLAEVAPDGSLVPALATEIPSAGNGGISDDLTTVTWKIQEGIVWADGSPLTSADVVFTWQYCTDELTGCSSSGFVGVVDVAADDELTVTITFDGPKPYPFEVFVGYTSPIIQQAQFADCVGEAAAGCSAQNLAPIGTGPYTITDFRPEDVVTYELNPNYRKAAEGKPYFGTVVIQGGGEAEAAARSVLEIGEADYAWNLQVAPEILQPMEAAGNGRVVTSFTANVEHINLNQTSLSSDPPSDYNEGTNPSEFFFENPQLHRALSLAINRDELVEVGYGPTGSPTCNMWPVGSQASTNNDWCLTQDIAEANRILDEDLGYMDTDGDGVRELPDGTPLEWDYVTSTNAVRQSNQALVETYWAEIGVKANMKNEDAGIFFDGTSPTSIWSFPWDVEMFTNGSSTSDPAAYLKGWITEQIPESSNNYSGDNMPRQANAEYDAIITELSTTPLDDPGLDALVIAANDILVNGAVIPLIHRGNVSGISLDIEGYGDPNGWDSEYWNVEDWFRAE
ncbi:MAG: peptide ABC transporter substrate-binding protein, partial [Actinomycetia bacterium]|nr:peptide ABC transporter substrate-binding protein [Actinomycetes bacterium]